MARGLSANLCKRPLPPGSYTLDIGDSEKGRFEIKEGVDLDLIVQ